MRKITMAVMAAMLVVVLAGCNGPAQEAEETTVEETVETTVERTLPEAPASEQEARDKINATLPAGAPTWDEGETFADWQAEMQAFLRERNAATQAEADRIQAEQDATFEEHKQKMAEHREEADRSAAASKADFEARQAERRAKVEEDRAALEASPPNNCHAVRCDPSAPGIQTEAEMEAHWQASGRPVAGQ